jgi:hypothetical protein
MLEVKISSLYVKQSWVQIAKGNAFGSQVRPGLQQTPQKKKTLHDEIDDDVFAIV